MLESKIQEQICETIQPLFDIWKEQAKWTEEEATVMYHKLFDPEKPCDFVIQDIMADKFGKEFLYYHRKKISRLYRSARKKLNKVLP